MVNFLILRVRITFKAVEFDKFSRSNNHTTKYYNCLDAYILTRDFPLNWNLYIVIAFIILKIC